MPVLDENKFREDLEDLGLYVVQRNIDAIEYDRDRMRIAVRWVVEKLDEQRNEERKREAEFNAEMLAAANRSADAAAVQAKWSDRAFRLSIAALIVAVIAALGTYLPMV